MKFLPRPYQEAGIELMLRESGVGLFLEPGSGKTVTALTAADILMNECLSVQKTLVVAPKMVAQEVWHRECAKWDHLAHLQVFHIDSSVFDYYRKVTSSAIWGSEQREIVRNRMTDEEFDFLFCADVVVDRFEMLPRDWRKSKENILRRRELIHVVSRDHFYNLIKLLGTDWPYDMVLGDESTMFKNHDSKRSHAMEYLRDNEMIRRLALMTGTPSPRGLENLWAQARLLDGGRRLGSEIGKFRKTYMLPDKTDGRRVFNWKAKPGSAATVTDKLKDICLAVRADIWRETDPPRTVEHVVTLPGEVMDQYRELADHMHLLLEDGTGIAAEQAAILGNKLIQLASGAVFDNDGNYHVLHDAKLEALDELIEELDGEPLLLVYWFKPTLVRLKARYGKRLVTTKTKGFIDRFARGEVELLAVQPAGAGHGLDGLQAGGHHLAVVDLFHDWEAYQQVVSRLDRSGQKHRVTVHQLLAAGTKDLQVARVLANRGADQGMVMDALKWQA